MKSLLIALGLALCCLVQAKDQPFANADLTQISGIYYVGAIVTTCQKMKEILPRMPASTISLERKSADEVKMTMNMPTPHGCKMIHPVLKRENGVFTTTCGQGGKKTVGDINLSGNSLMTEITLTHSNRQCKMATLGVRDVSDVQKHLKEFRAFADRHGLKDEKINVLSKEGMCVHTL